MTTITPLAAPPATAAPSVSEASATLTADFETFLKLLTTQMQFQDPLNPVDNTEFVAQLAQFSTVEQAIASNETLGRIETALTGGGVGAFADLLDREVLSDQGVDFLAGSVEVVPPPPPSAASSGTLVVRGAGGVPVREIAFEPGTDGLRWDGETADGVLAPAGVYRFEAKYVDAVGAETVLPAEAWSRVVEVQRDAAAGATLKLAGGGQIGADAITAIR